MIKKIFLLLFIIFYPLSSYSFTLLSANPPQYGTDEVVFNVANDNCLNIGLAPETLLDLVEDAMDQYWNSVPTSRLKFVRGGVTTNSANGEATISSFITNSGSVDTIIVGCNNDFGANAGQGGYQSDSTGVKGGFLINDNSQVATLSKEQRMALIAHEIGHAFGLGHSNFEPALMHYQLNNNIKYLSRDDEDGISYLYPNTTKVGGCGTIEYTNGNNSDKKGLFAISMFLMALLLCRFNPQKYLKRNTQEIPIS